MKTNNDRAAQKERLVTTVQDTFRKFTKQALMDRLEKTGLPFAPIGKPEELLDDLHLNANEGLLDVSVTEGEHAGSTMRLPALPLAMSGHRFGVHQDIARAGEHTREVLSELGYDDEQIDHMLAEGIVSSS